MNITLLNKGSSQPTVNSSTPALVTPAAIGQQIPVAPQITPAQSAQYLEQWKQLQLLQVQSAQMQALSTLFSDSSSSDLGLGSSLGLGSLGFGSNLGLNTGMGFGVSNPFVANANNTLLQWQLMNAMWAQQAAQMAWFANAGALSANMGANGSVISQAFSKFLEQDQKPYALNAKEGEQTNCVLAVKEFLQGILTPEQFKRINLEQLCNSGSNLSEEQRIGGVPQALADAGIVGELVKFRGGYESKSEADKQAYIESFAAQVPKLEGAFIKRDDVTPKFHGHEGVATNFQVVKDANGKITDVTWQDISTRARGSEGLSKKVFSLRKDFLETGNRFTFGILRPEIAAQAASKYGIALASASSGLAPVSSQNISDADLKLAQEINKVDRSSLVGAWTGKRVQRPEGCVEATVSAVRKVQGNLGADKMECRIHSEDDKIATAAVKGSNISDLQKLFNEGKIKVGDMISLTTADNLGKDPSSISAAGRDLHNHAALVTILMDESGKPILDQNGNYQIGFIDNSGSSERALSLDSFISSYKNYSPVIYAVGRPEYGSGDSRVASRKSRLSVAA